MPYMCPDELKKILISSLNPENTSELSFLFTYLIGKYMTLKGLSYQVIDEVFGALERTKLEFHARIAHPYEDRVILLEGDVYEDKFK